MTTTDKSAPHAFHPASTPDYLPADQLRQLQFDRLTRMVGRAYDRVALFCARMDERGLTPRDVRGLEDLAKLPFTVKADLGVIEKAGMNVEYMYAFTFRREDKAIIVLRFENPDAGIRALQAQGINVIGPVELYERAAR